MSALRRLVVGLLLAALLLATAVAALAQAGSLDVAWFTADGGGGASSGGGYTLSGSMGQPDAGSQQGGAYHVEGGFWSADINALPPTFWLYLPLVQR